MRFKTGDQVTIKSTVDPNDNRIGTIRYTADNVTAQVDWDNSCKYDGNCTCEKHYLSNLELYKRPFEVGDEVYLYDDIQDKGRIIALHGSNVWVDNYSDHGKNWGPVTFNTGDLTHAT